MPDRQIVEVLTLMLLLGEARIGRGVLGWTDPELLETRALALEEPETAAGLRMPRRKQVGHVVRDRVPGPAARADEDTGFAAALGGELERVGLERAGLALGATKPGG